MFLSWIPVIGPIIQGVVSIFTKKMDTTVQTTKINRENDLGEAQVSAQIIHDTNDDIALRFMRDVYCLPAVVQVSLTGWDSIVAENSWHIYMWHVSKFPPSLEWYPFTVACFLLGNIGLNMWKRR